MVHNSDPSHATANSSNSDNDSDHPRTPPLTSTAAPRSRANTGRSHAARSRIPKLRTASVSRVQVQVQPQAPISPPRTPADRDTKPAAALDWGSGGEWSAIVGETKRSTSKMGGEAVDDYEGDALVEVGEDADDLSQQPAVASSGLFDDFEHASADFKRPVDSILPKEVSDDDEPLIVFEDGDRQGLDGDGEEDGLHGGVVLETNPYDSAASQTSDSEDFDLRTKPALRAWSSAAVSSDGVSDDEVFPVVSVLKESEERAVEQDGPHDTPEEEEDLSHAGTSEDSGSDSDISATSGSKQSGNAERFKNVSDDEQHSVVSAPKDIAQNASQQQNLHVTAVQDADSSDADVSQTSSSDSDLHTAPAPTQSDVSERLEANSHDVQHSVTSASEDVGQHIGFTETELLDGNVFNTSDSDVSDMELPPVTICGPFLNPIGRVPITENSATVSPEIVLRGLIRDAHSEMIHFTLPHSLFSPDDLRKGLQYAYITLQVATSKLAILDLLNDETTSMTGSDLRRWIALVDNSSPHARTDPRISVLFEFLSIGEMKAALEELVQSRLVVEGEAEKTLMLLLTKAEAKERQEKSVVIPAKRAAAFDEKGNISTKKRRVSEEDNETVLDAFLTVVMVVLIGALYLCLREYPVGSVVHRWINM